MANSPPPVLVTGATGYIATEVVAQLLREGVRVRGTVRSLSKGARLREGLAHRAPTEGLELVEANLLDARSWVAACRGVEEVYHIASPFSIAKPKTEDYFLLPAREGTLNVLRAATRAGVRRVVLTSSVAAVTYPRFAVRGRLYDERDWTDPTLLAGTSAYVRSKTIAERAGWSFVARHESAPELVSVCPGLVLGPLHGRNRSASHLTVSKLLDGEIPAVPRIQFELVDVRDIAALHRSAMATPRAAGERFIGGSGCRTLREVSRTLRAMYPVLGRMAPRVQAPDWGARLVALYDADAEGVLYDLGEPRACSHAKAAELLGWRPRSPEEAIAATADSLLGLGTVAPVTGVGK